MTDTFNVVKIRASDADKIRQHLEAVREVQTHESEANIVVSSATEQFNQFFLEYGKPYFAGNKLHLNDTPVSDDYNENLTTLDSDIQRSYDMLSSHARDTLSAFNYSTILSKEILNSADNSASKVLDLNILNGFTKGSTIVAGDDFSDETKVDRQIGVDSTQADLIKGANAIGLKKVGSEIISSPNVTVSITPVKPKGENDKVNVEPTPFNLERFYEGKYYAYIGEQEPEGRELKLKYIVDPSDIPSVAATTLVNGQEIANGDVAGGAEAAIAASQGVGFFAVIPSTEEEKAENRAKMFDGNPDTYWQCEVVYQAEPLIEPFDSKAIDIESRS